MSTASPENVVYLDHAAASPPAAGLYRRMEKLAEKHFFNPHGGTGFSAECQRLVREAGRRAMAALDIPFDEAVPVWTSGGTEAVNLAVASTLAAAGGRPCLVDCCAHASVLASCRALGERAGKTCLPLPVDRQGAPKLESLPQRPGAVILTHVNNETGAIQDPAGVRQALPPDSADALLFLDATQSAGKLAIPWRSGRIGMVALGGRKFGAPPSVGLLVARKGLEVTPLFHGGGQQGGLRAGTVDTAAVATCADVLWEAAADVNRNWDRVCALRARLLEGLKKLRGNAWVRVSPPSASPYITCVAFPGYEGAVLMRLLADKGIVVGSGSACSASSREPSHVLTAMGHGQDVARGALRISFGADTTPQHVAAFIDALPDVLRDY
jgi:cysteine desulfurase